jgi:PHD/FYVE-zinc-finger like domain
VSTRSGRIISLPNGYREDESDLSLSDTAYVELTRRSSRAKSQPSGLRYEMSEISDDESEMPSAVNSRRSSTKPRARKVCDEFPEVEDPEDEFSRRHHFWCIFANDNTEIDPEDGQEYVMCQGCSFMYHVECLGKGRHNFITLDERDYTRFCVLQCGKCAGIGKNGANTVRCAGCGELGDRCGEFVRPEKVGGEAMTVEGTLSDEMKSVLLTGWNDPEKVMFRCTACDRAWHFDHLPPMSEEDVEAEIDLLDELKDVPVPPNADQQNGEHQNGEHQNGEHQNGEHQSGEHQNGDQLNGLRQDNSPPTDEDIDEPDKDVMDIDASALKRGTPSPADILQTYTSNSWKCLDCYRYSANKVTLILAHRVHPSPSPTAPPDFSTAYLVKFEDKSFARTAWVTGPWLAGVAPSMKKNYDAKGLMPATSATEVIPEAWLRADMVLAVRYDDDVSREGMRFRGRQVEMDALPRVTSAFIKWQKLTYEECSSPG